jgi:oligogalacturonide lyase
VDQDTGHRIVRLSKEPGSQSLYFHQNAYSPDGRKLMISTPSGISTVDLQTREIEQVVEGRVAVIMTGRKTGQIYYSKDRVVYAVDPQTRQSHEVAKLPDGGGVNCVNSDETLLAGTITYQPDGKPMMRPSYPPTTGPTTNASIPALGSDASNARPVNRGEAIARRFNQHLPMDLFVIDIKSGEVKKFNHSTQWLNHLQFSPTDPQQLLFCHEGPWHQVDRTWTIRADGTGLQQIHHRTMAMEIEGHEWFSADGQTVWYDLQTPRGEDFWVAGYNLKSGERTWYHLQRDEWSVHFNTSPDGKLFAGDGGDPGQVAKAPNGQWIYLFRPEMLNDRSGPDIDSSKMIKPGVFRAEKLVNMSKHEYRLEPNVTFTPDAKWIVFRSNMFGPTHVFAVEVGTSK